MKLLKLLSLLSLVMSLNAFADSNPGSPVVHKLLCKTSNVPANEEQVFLEVTTQALNPENDVREISVTTREMNPGAEKKVTALEQIYQDLFHAVFVKGKIVVVLEKENLLAELQMDNLNYSCKE